jgi:hypothetical protein
MASSELERVDRMTLYKAPGHSDPRPTGASGLFVSDLYRLRLLSDDQVKRLQDVADIVSADGSFCDSDELLDAWLDAFELLASVHEEDY